MKITACLLSLWLHLLWVSAAQALSLPEVIKELRQDYPPLLAARAKIRQSEGKLLEKQGGFDTQFKSSFDSIPIGYYQHLALDAVVEQATPWWGSTWFSGYRLGQGQIADYDGKKRTLHLGEIRMGLKLPLLRNGAIDPLRAELSRLELQLSMARLQARESELKFVASALKAYWNWVAAQQKEAIALALLELTQTRVQQLETEIQLGKTPRITRSENQRALLKRRSKVLEMQQQRQQKGLELGLFLRAGQLPDPSLAPGFPVLNSCLQPPAALAETLTQALQQRPEKLLLELQLAQNEVGQALAENQLLPNLDLYLSLSQDFGAGDKSLAPLSLDSGLRFDFPLQWRKAQGQIMQLAAEREQLEWQAGFVSTSIRTEIQSTQLALQTACQQIVLAEQESALALLLAEAERDRFALGSSDLFIVNLREQSAADAQERQQEALADYFLAEGQYLLSLGLLPQ